MSATRWVDLTPIENAASRLETLQRLFACYALFTFVTLVRSLPDLVKPDQTAFLKLPGELGRRLMATGINPETYLRRVSFETAIALVILLVVAMASNRWLLRLFAVIAAALFGIVFLWSSFMLGVAVIGLITGEAARVYSMTGRDYVLTLLLRIVWATTAGALAANAVFALIGLSTRSRDDLALLRTSGAGRWISLRRFFCGV
ncbi:MAG TPA: hypothetical protein VH988_12095 [Thermoanaerobaculia bacterium]|jgi:hypothetical protein|nr:hypothetical protein [Thermoanaerobaculia bacterium]